MADQKRWFKVWTSILSDDDFDPSQSRLKVIFADALDHSINVTHVAAVLASCINEGKPKVQDQAPEAPASPTPPFTNIPL